MPLRCRHLTFAAEPAGTGLKPSRPSQLVVCRARRAWLPPSSLWLFKPLSFEHDIGAGISLASSPLGPLATAGEGGVP